MSDQFELPETGSRWQDSYAVNDRVVSVLSVKSSTVGRWLVTCQEKYGFNREFSMGIDGFYERFRQVSVEK